MVGVWIPVLVCLYSCSELAKADDKTPTSSPTPPTDDSASAVGFLRGMTVAHNSDALTKGRTQEYSKVKEDLLASSYPREITYGNSDIKNELTVNLKESSSKKKEYNKVAYNVLSTDSLKQNKRSFRNTRKLDQNYYKSHLVRPSVKQNNFLASNLEQILPIKNELANNSRFKSELSNINFKNCVDNHLKCSKNKKKLIKNDRLKYKSQAHIINKRKYMLSVLGVLNGKFKNQSKKSENILDSLNKAHGLTKSNNLKVIEKTKPIENEINIDRLYGDLKTQHIDIKNEDSPVNNYDTYEKQRKRFSDSLVDLKDLETDDENRKYNNTLIRSRRQNNLQFLTDIDNINNRSKEQHKLCWTETVTITTNIKTNSSENSHEIIKEYGVVWERPVSEENLSPVSLGKKNKVAKETLSRENINENYLSSNERELLSNSSKKMVKYKIISSNPNQTVKQIETTYCKTGNQIDVETIINNKRKNQRTKFNLLPKEKTIIHSNNDSDIFEPSLESQLDPHVKRTRSINLSEAGDTILKPNKLFEKVRFDHGTLNITELSQNQDVTIPKKVREILGSKSIFTQWHPTEKAKTTASYETGEDSSYYGDHEDYDYYSDYTDYFDESHFNKTKNNTIYKVENLSHKQNKRGKISKGSVEDIASIEQSSDEAEVYESESLKHTENIDHVKLESLTSIKPSQYILNNNYENHKHLMVLDAQTSPINHKSSQEDYTVKSNTGGVYLETKALTSQIIRETYTKIPIVEGISLRSDLPTNNSKISPTIKQINLKLKMSTSTPHVTYTEKKPGITLIDSSKNYDSTINSNENRSYELTSQSKIPQEKSKRGNIFKKAILQSGRSPDRSTTENTTEKILIKSTINFDKVHMISKENSTQPISLESTTEPHTSQLTTIKGNTSIKIILESDMRSYEARDSSTKENTFLGSDSHEISSITPKMYIDKSHKIPTKNVTGEEILQSGLNSDTLNEISLKNNVNKSINIEQITSFYTINDLIATEMSTKLLSLNKYSNILNNNTESENENGLISLESATYLGKSQEALFTENPIEDILTSQTTPDILVDNSTKENIFAHITLDSDKSSGTSYEILVKSSDVSISKIKTGNESLGDSLMYLDNYPHFDRTDLEKELSENSTYTSSLESKGSNNEISEFGDFSHSSDTISMGKADDDIVLSQDDITDVSLSTENNLFDTTSEPDTYTNIYDKETYTEKSLSHIPGYKFINSSTEVTYTENENIYRPRMIEDEDNSENINENYTAENLDENISLESTTFLDQYLDQKEDTTINGSPKSRTVSKLATVDYNLTSINDNIMRENIGILKLTTDKPISNISNSFLVSNNLMENTIEPLERSNIENEMLEFTTLKSLPVELTLNDSLFLDSTIMIDKSTEKRIGGTIVQNTSNLDTLLKNNEETFDDNNNTGLLIGLFNDSQDIIKVNTKNNKNESLEDEKSTLDVNTENLENKLTTQSKLTVTTQDKLFTYNSSLESSNLLATTIKTPIENLSFYSSLDYTTSPGKIAESGVKILLENVSIESVARSDTVREPTNETIEVTRMKVMNEELNTETSPTYLKYTHLSRPTKKAKNKISFDNLYSELSTLSALENSPMTNKRPNVKVSLEKIALGTSSPSQNKGESKVETSTENVLRKFSTLLVMNKQSESETSNTNLLSDSFTTLRNNIMSLVETTTKSELIELDSISRNTNIAKTETFKEIISIKPSTSSDTSLASLETSISNVSIELLTPSRLTEHSPIEALNVNSALEWSSMSGKSIIPEVEKSTENVSLEFSTLSGEANISLKYTVTESLTVQSDKLLGNNSISSVNKLIENVGKESSTLSGVIGQLAIETLNESISIESSTLSEEISMAANGTSTNNVLFESTKLSGKAALKSVEISNSNVSMTTFIHSEMTEQSPKDISNAKTIDISRPLGNSIIPPKVKTSSENLSSDHAPLSVNTVMPLVDILSEAVSINLATLSGNAIISSIETLTENISNDFITLSESTSMPSVEISYSNMSMESAIPLGDTDQSEIYNSNIPFESSKTSGNSVISKGETFTENVSLESATLSGNTSIPAVETFTKDVHNKSTPSGMTELSEILNSNLLLESFTISDKSILPEKEISTGHLSLESDTLSVTTIMPSVETFKEIISNDFYKPSETTSIRSVEISNSNMSMESVNLLIKTGQSEIETLNPNITLNLFTPSEEIVTPAVKSFNENVSSGFSTSSENISMPSVKPFIETTLMVNSTFLGINEQSPINTSIANLLLEYFTLSGKSIITDKKPYDENMLLESVTLSGINNMSSLETFSEIISIDFSTVSENTKIASVETSTKQILTESYTPSGVTVQSEIETSNANLSLDNFTLSENSIIHGEETSTGNILLESVTSSGITIMPSVEMFTEKNSIESLTLLGNTNILPRETLIENMPLNSSTILGITNMPQEETFTSNIANNFTLSDYSSMPLVETPSTNLSIDSPTLSLEYAKREGISISSANISKANVSFVSSTLSRVASDTSEETSNMNISLESTRQSTISMMPTFEKSSSNVYLDYGTLSGMYGDSSLEISTFGVPLELATHPRMNKNIPLETSIVNISLETSTSLGLFEKPPRDVSNQNVSVEFVKPTIETEQTLLETSTVNVPIENTTLFGVLNERSKEKSILNKSLETVTLIGMSGEKGIETTFNKVLEFTKILETSTDTSLYKYNATLPLKSIEQLKLTTNTLKETSTENVTLEYAKLLGITQELLEEMSIPTESLELVPVVEIGRNRKPFPDIMTGNESLESDTLHITTREPIKEKFIPTESLELVTVIGTTREPSVEITTVNVALESATLLEMTREPLKDKSNLNESLELVTMIGTTIEPLLDIMTGNISLETATLLEMTREPLKETSNLTESLELVTMIGTTREHLQDIMTGNVSLESATLLEMTREPLKEKSNLNESLELVTMIGTTIEPLLDIFTGNLSLESATILEMTREPLKEKSNLNESLELVTMIETTREPLLDIFTGNVSLESATLLEMTREPLKEKSNLTESLELVTMIGTTREHLQDIMTGNLSLESATLLEMTREPLKETYNLTESLELVTMIGTTRENLQDIMTGNVSLESATLLEMTREPLKETSNLTESLELVTVIRTTRVPSVEINTGNVSLESATLLEMTREPLKEKSILTESRELVTITRMAREPVVKTMTENVSFESATLFGITLEPIKEKIIPTESLELVTEIRTTGVPELDIMTGNVSLDFSTLLGKTREPLKETALINSVDGYTVSEEVKRPLAHIRSVNETLKNEKILSITREPFVGSSSSLGNEKNSTMTESELNSETLFKIKEISTVGNFSFNVSLESATKYQMVEDLDTDTSTIDSSLKSESLPGKTYVSLEEHFDENVSLVNPTLLETTSENIKEPLKKNISLESVNLLITTRKPRIKTTDKAVFLEYSPLLLALEKSATTEKIYFDYASLPLPIKVPERETTSQNVSLEPITLEDRTKISEIESTAQSVSLELVPLIATTGVSEIIPTTQHVPLEYVPSKIKLADLQLKPMTQILSLESISSTAMTEELEIKTTNENLPLKAATLSARTGKSNIKHTTQNIPFESSTLSVTRGESKTKPYTQNTLLKSSTLGITTDVSEIENTNQNVLLESVTLLITTEESEIETTNKYSPLESVPLVAKTEISEIQSTTQDLNLNLISLSNKAENSEIEPATQKSFLKYLPLTFSPRISETKHTSQNETLKSLPVEYTTQISERELTTETVSLESVTSEITTEESEIKTTNQDAPLKSVPLKVKTGISEIQSTTQEVHLESNTLLDKEEISEIELTTQKPFLENVSLTFTPGVLETEHTDQNESLKSLPITYTTEILEIEPTTQTVPLEAVTFSATNDSSDIEITTETVYLESVTLAITTEESEIETTNKDSTMESVPLKVKTGMSEIQSTTQDVLLESITLSDKAEISEIEPTTQKSFLKNVPLTFTPIVSETAHTAQNESLRYLPITYTTEILDLEQTIQTVVLDLVTLSATTDISEIELTTETVSLESFPLVATTRTSELETTTQTLPLELVTLTTTTDVSEIELTTKTVSLESVPLVATTETSEMEPTTQTVTFEPLALTSMTVVSKEEQNTLAVSIESDPLTVTTEVSKIESISTNVSEFDSLNAITGISLIEQTTQDESLEPFPLSDYTGISAIEPTPQDISQEWTTLMATTKKSQIETTNPNLSFESDNLPVITKESDIQTGTQNVDFDSSTLFFKTAGSKIKSNTKNTYLESISLSATSGESEIKPISKNVSIESVNLTLPTEESLINFYTQNFYINSATLSLPTLGSLTEYSTENLYSGSTNLPQIKENVLLEISPLIKYSKYDTQIKMTAMSGQEISPANLLLEYNNITNTTKESSLKSSIKNIYYESLNSLEQTKDLGIVNSFDNVDLLSENQREIVEESSVGNYLTSIGLENASIYVNSGVEISTVNESLENNNLTVDWSLETSSISVEASTGESALETSTLNVLWDSSTLSRTGDISVETTILNKALETKTINGEKYASTRNSNTGDSLEITTLMDMAREPAVDTSNENYSFEYATIREIKEVLTVEKHPSSGVYWDSTKFPSTTEYSTVDLSSLNASLESATFSGITSVALEFEPKVTKNHSLSSSNNSKQNLQLIAETSTKYFKSDKSTFLDIKGSVMKEYIPKNLYLKSKTYSELTKEGFTDNALLTFTNLLLSPQKTKFGYTKENYTSIYSPLSHSNNQTTTKYDIVRSKNVHTVTTAKPDLDKVSESGTYPTVNVRENSKFESLIEQISSDSDQFQYKTSTINPIFDQVSSENSDIKYQSFQETSTVEPIVSQVSLGPYIFHPASKQEIFKLESIDNQILSKIVVTTINPPKTSTNNRKANHTSLEPDSISIPRQPERYTVETMIDQESLGPVTVAPLQSKGNTTRIPLFYQVPLLNFTNAQKIYMKEPASDQPSLESEALTVSKIENITQVDKVTGPSLVYGKLILPETILEPIILNESVTFKNSNIHDISKTRLVDGQISHKTLKSPNVNYFEVSNDGFLNDTKLIEFVANPKTYFKETQTVKSTFKQGYIGSFIITTSSNQETSSDESIFDQKSLISANNSSNSALKPFLAEPTKDKIGLTKYKDYAKLNIFSINQFYNDSFRNKNIIGEYYQKPINFTKGITVEEQKDTPEQINSISTFDQHLEHLNHPFSTNKTKASVESLSEIRHNGSINLPLKLQDYTTIQPFSEQLYLAFDNIYIPKITHKHKTKLVFGSQNLSREEDDHYKNQLTDHEIILNYTITGKNINSSHVKQSLFDQIMSKWENAQSKEVLKGVSYIDTKKHHGTDSEANNNIITNRTIINVTKNKERSIMPRSRHKEVESTDDNYQVKNEVTKRPELILSLPTIDIDPIYKNTLYSENKFKTFHAPKEKEKYTPFLENDSQIFNSVKDLSSSLLDQNFQTDNAISIYESTKPVSDEVAYTDSREDYFTTTEFAIDMLSTESNEASDEFYDSTTEDVSYGYTSNEDFTTTEISTYDPESTEINFDESISEENTKTDFTTTEYSTDSEEDTNEIANQRMIVSRYFQPSYKPLSFLNTSLLENSTRNDNLDEIKNKEDERKTDEKDNMEITITELYNGVYEELGTEESVTISTGHMGVNSNQMEMNEDTNDNSEWTTTLDSVWNIWTKKPNIIKTRLSDEIIPDVEINYPKYNIEKSQSIEMTTLEIIPAKSKYSEKNINSNITLNNDVNNNKIHKEYNDSTEQSSEEETSIENLKNVETGVFEPNIELGSLKLYLSNSEKYSHTTEDENLVRFEKQTNDFKNTKDKAILIENKYETKPSTLKYSEQIIKGGKIQSDVPENITLASHLHFNNTTKETNNIYQFNNKTRDFNHLNFTIEPVERSTRIKHKSRFSDYTEPIQITKAISNNKLSDLGEFREFQSTNMSSIFPNTELEYRLTKEKNTDSKYPDSNIDTIPYFPKTENLSVSFLTPQNNKMSNSRKHNILKGHRAHIYQNIPRSLQTGYANREMNNYETTPLTKLYNRGENKFNLTKETLENIERENYSKNIPKFLHKESIVLNSKNSDQLSLLLPNQYKIDSNESSFSWEEYEKKTIPVSTTFYGSGEINANIPCTNAQNINHSVEYPTIGTRNFGFNLTRHENERNPLQERRYTVGGQLETLNSKTNLTLQQLMKIFHSKSDLDKDILRHNNLTNNLTVKQILDILYSKVKETAQNQQKYIENKTKEGTPMFDHSSISKARSEISIKQTMQGSKNNFVEIYNDTPRKKQPILELVNCNEKGKNDFEYDYYFDQYDESNSDKSHQNNRKEQTERDILCQVPPEDMTKLERENQDLKKLRDNTADDINIPQFYDDDRVLSYDSEYGINDDERQEEDYRRMDDTSNIEGYKIGNQENINDYPMIMSDQIIMPQPFDTNLGQIIEDNEQNIGSISDVSDPTIFYYHTTYKDKNQRFTPYDYARYFGIGPQKYTHGISNNARYNRYENRGIKKINVPNNFRSNLEKYFDRETYRNNFLRRRPIRRKYQTTFSKTNMLSQNIKYAPSEEYTKRIPRVTLTKLKRRNPTFIRMPYLLLRNEYLRANAKPHTHRENQLLYEHEPDF